LGLARRVGLTQEDAEDVVQQAYIRVLPLLANGAAKNPKGLLYAAVRNQAKDAMRKLARESNGLNCLPAPGASPSAQDQAINNEVYAEIMDAIQELPEHQRGVILCMIEGFKPHQIAARFETAIGIIYSRSLRARATLRVRLAGLLAEFCD